MTAPLTILIDEACPLCRREAAALRRLDRGRGRIAFVDISAPGFDASRYGATQAEVMGAIHAVKPDGQVFTGMEVFRRAYSAVGLGWLLAPTGWPLVRPLVDRAYRWFARTRHRFGKRRDGACDSGACLPDSNA